jgi:light-regulated signal transduction histidine kinase (bacteriophytochrome)
LLPEKPASGATSVTVRSVVGGNSMARRRRIAELHGGGVATESRPGEGSTFTVRLPSVAS